MIRWKLLNQIWILISFCCFIQRTFSLTVDNELVSARNDCFERVALEAMIPFEKTFKTEDTNSLRMCRERCLQEGDKCQSISFGVHRRGNGTCQLSKEKYKIGSRPSGVIFDPDFDLYARKTNCFDLTDNTLRDQSDDLQETNDYGSSLSPTAAVLLPSRPTANTPILLEQPNPTVVTTLQEDTTHYVAPTTGFGQRDSPAVFNQGPPPATYEHNTQNIPSTPASNGDRLYFSQDIYPLYKYPTLYEPNYPAPNQDVYIPGGYAANAQEVEDHYRPTSYDSNVRPSVSPSYHSPPKPIFGLGYGTGFGYGPPEPYNPPTMRPQDVGFSTSSQTANNVNRDSQKPQGYGHSNRDPYRLTSYDNDNRDTPSSYDNTTPSSSYFTRPNNAGSSLYTYSDRLNNENHSSSPFGPRPYGEHNTSPAYEERPSNDHNTSPGGYEPRPEYSNSSPPPYLPPGPAFQRPGDFIDFTNRPDAPDGTAKPTTYGPSFDDDSYTRRNDTATFRPTSGYNDDKYINTYFNPEDYITGNKKRPDYFEDSKRPNYNRGPMKACFRRVLAGKRVAPHWVRRTIACERVEECMRECGREKRFTCEGFNYRLDPSGHGQGDCELIEIPLDQIDLYSSPNRRDSNLLRHPDYDYYERDRNAPHSCRYNMCKECSPKLPAPPSLPHYNKPSQGWSEKPFKDERYPHIPPSPPSSSGSGYYSRPLSSSSSLEHYPSGPPPPHHYQTSYESHARPPYSDEHHSDFYDFSSHGSSYYEHSPPSSYGSSDGSSLDPVDRYDVSHGDRYRWESIPSSSGYDGSKHDRYRPPYRSGSDYTPYRPSDSHASTGPESYRPGPPAPSHNYLDRNHSPISSHKKNTGKFVPYLIGTDNEWGSYGGSYGGSRNKQTAYWGLNDSQYKPKDSVHFDYSNLGPSATSKTGGFRRDPPHESNAVISYSGSGYGAYGKYDGIRDRHDYQHQWTRRPGPDECSAKTSEGFRLHKKIVKHMYSTPSVTECERLCSGQDGFICHTYSYRYSSGSHDNCMLCDRPINRLDYYVDIEPDRDYDIYSMSDDMNVCKKPSRKEGPARRGGGSTIALADPKSTQCFFRAIDATRFYKSIVRDSLTVRSVGECEMECIKSTKFTCRAFAFRYGQQRHASVIDNCQLSDWPVRDMDKERHLVLDKAFDIYERASYGHGCEIQPIVDEKHKKSVCYLGYGSPAKLLPAAIKKVVTVPSELECKKECVRLRETTAFKCYSFSYGSRKTTFNCEMSDCDQTELKLNVHYKHTDDRDYWLFAWNPFDFTCRDKVNTIGGSRVKNNRRMDIFREPGNVALHYSVSGKPCRHSSPCEKNLITGFYSCEIEGGEVGSWDYCCKVEHPCGYSQGFDYPWCFVGDEPDQWRKCSDRYYPGNHTLTHAELSVKPLKPFDKRKPTDSFTSASNSDEYQKPPRPGGLQSLSDFTAARLWPVTYLYSEGPPNSTEFSNFVDCNKETC